MKTTIIGKGLAFASALGLALVSVPGAVQAQTNALAEQPEKLTWVRIEMTRFHPGKRERAIEIIKNYFAKADQLSGVDSGVHGVHFDTGEWDIIYVFPMKGGPADMAEQTSPDEEKWMAQMVKLAGSEDAAKKIMDEYGTLVAAEVTQIGHAHADH
jgi:hypothetical protein